MNASLERLCEQFDRHLNPIAEDVGFTAKEYSIAKGYSINTARRRIANLLQDGVIERIGSRAVVGLDRITKPAPVYDFVKANKCKSKR